MGRIGPLSPKVYEKSEPTYEAILFYGLKGKSEVWGL